MSQVLEVKILPLKVGFFSPQKLSLKLYCIFYVIYVCPENSAPFIN